MSEELTIHGETPGASHEGTLAIELFLNENYRFRRNILNGKVEFATLPEAAKTAEGLSSDFNEAELEFRPLTPAALNSIVIHAKREEVLEKGSPKSEISEWVGSEEVPEYNPVQAFLNGLPKWDGQNHIARLFSRIPGERSPHFRTNPGGSPWSSVTVWPRTCSRSWRRSTHSSTSVAVYPPSARFRR